MSDTDWNNVAVPDREPEPEPKSPIPGSIGFALMIILLVAGGAAFLNLTVFGNRVKDRAIAECEPRGCILDVQANHDQCFTEGMVWRAPQGLADFQTPETADTLGILSVDYAAYRQCAGVNKPKTLSEAEAAGAK